MATCVVSGTFTNPQGNAVSGATVRFSTERPVLDNLGNLIMPKEITTTTATDGTWSLTIIQQVSGTLTLDLTPSTNSPVVKYTFSLVIPSTTTATFASCWVENVNFGGQSTSTPLTFASISGTLAQAQLPALADTKLWVGNSSSLAMPVVVSGDGSLADTGALTINTVGTSTAANLHSAEQAANAATSANTASTILKRDGSGQVAATTFTGSLAGNATTATTASNLSGSFTGDVNGTQAATVVVAIQGSSVANTTPTDGQALIYRTSNTKYNPVSLSGDAAVSNTGAVTLATVNSNVGSFGDATHVGAVTLDGKGRVTAAASTAIQIAESQVTGLVSDLAAKQSTTLTNTHILVGNGSNLAADVAVSGDATIANTGALTLATVNANVGTFGSTTVNAKGLVTAAGNLTGDGTTSGSALTLATVNGNVGTFASATFNAKGLATAAANLSGDATTSGSALTLATVNSNVGSFTNANITVNAKGLVTAAANGSGGSASLNYYAGYMPGATSWTTTSTTFADPTNSGNNTLTSRTSSGITVTAAASNLPGITFTPPASSAVYLITAIFPLTNNAGNSTAQAQLTDGSTVITSSAFMQTSGSPANYVSITLSGIYAPATTSAVTVKIQLACDSNTAKILNNHNSVGNIVEWTVLRIV